MILSRSKPSLTTSSKTIDIQNHFKFEDFIIKRDYTGAVAYLEFKKNYEPNSTSALDLEIWLAYCHFHLGNYKKALDVYKKIYTDNKTCPNMAYNIACCYFYLGMIAESEEYLKHAPKTPCVNRLALHLSYRTNGQNIELLSRTKESISDQMTQAALLYMRGIYKEAIDIYKKILNEHKDFLAVNVYMALCYYKLDYFDLSQETLQTYTDKHTDSAIATNLKLCNVLRLFGSPAALNEIRTIQDQSKNTFGYDLVRHNSVVFKQGKGALQVLPALIDVIPEARLNLITYYLKEDAAEEAFELSKDLKASTAHESILKATVLVILGQLQRNTTYIKQAQEYYQNVGESSTECDTIPGRECMASLFFLHRQFEEVLVYLSSIKTFYRNDDETFNFNYAQAKCATGNFKEAENAFLTIQSDKIKNDPVYITHLCRCFIMNKKPQRAWDLCKKYEKSTFISFQLLQIIANDCYRIGEFLYAARAFDILEHIEPNPEYWEGKRGSIVGVFQGVIANIYPRDVLIEIIELLGKSKQNQEAQRILSVVRGWSKGLATKGDKD